MQTLEYTTCDKSGWGSGPWQNEPDKRQWRDDATGLPCLIVRGPSGALCGYVGVPADHPMHGKDYDSVPVDVHGGLTFASKCSHGAEESAICHKVEPDEPDDVWWLGFDCAHLGDVAPKYDSRNGRLGYDGDTYKDIAYVERETVSLAAQLSALSK